MIKRLLGGLDRWQRRHRAAAVAWATIKKFGDDNTNLQVVALGWYGFTAIFPLLLAVVTIFAFIGAASLGRGLVETLHRFPVVGPEFNPSNESQLHGSALGLAIGLVGLLYGAQGVTNTAQQSMASVWNIPKVDRTGFLPRLGRSYLSLLLIGLTFVVNAVASTWATGGGSIGVRVPAIAGLVVLNVAAYAAVFRALTAKQIPLQALVPGAALAGVGFTLLITVGTGLLTHQLQHSSQTYGAFGSVIGLVTFLLLLAKLSMYSAELNVILARRLYPRAMPTGELTDADRQVLADVATEQRQRPEQQIHVAFQEEQHEAGDPGAGTPVRGRS